MNAVIDMPFPFSAAIEEPISKYHPYLNYCCWPYKPPQPGEGKLRPSSLLFQAISEILTSDMERADWLAETIRVIQAGVGDFRSVYGIKRIGSQWALEVYVYDYAREGRLLSVERFFGACGGHLRLALKVPSHLPYFMFSFDLDEHVRIADGTVDVINVYIGNPGSSVSSGLSYRVTFEERRFENAYFFFDAKKQHQAICDKMACSVFRDAPRFPFDEVMPERLSDCNTVCIANKRMCDTVYFSGITLEQLRYFVEWQRYPGEFVKFIDTHARSLDHLLYDVGIDYRIDDSGLLILKSGIYGIF
jgi:hypothetical protein